MKRVVLVSLALWACTEAGLYDSKRSPIEANRVSLRGQVCTEDPEEAKFPVKLVVVADQAIGPLFGNYDPSALRIERLSGLVRSAIQRPEYSIAIVGYAGRAQKLAPTEGSFGRAIGDLLNGIQRLILPAPCLGSSCRDYAEGLRVARNLIEDDLAATPAGVRGLTQYVVVLLNGGRQIPFATEADCCRAGEVGCTGEEERTPARCQVQLDARIVAELRDAIAAQGGGGLEFHVMHMAAEDNADHDAQVADSHERMAFVGGGRYVQAESASGIDFKRLRLFDRSNTLKYKFFLATNRMALPTANGIVMDSDGDGLADTDEDLNEDGKLDPGETDPQSMDTDEDGISDLVESLTGLDPRAVDLPEPCEDLEPGDDDRDGLTNCDEAMLGTEQTLVDTDGDGVPDGLEVTFGTDYLNHDSVEDDDGDGVPNGEELRDHTDPRTTDLQARLGSSYRYEVEDLGTIVEPVVATPRTTLGVKPIGAGMGSTPGVGRLFFEPAVEGGVPSLGWQDAADMEPGPMVPMEADIGEYLLASSSYAPVQGEAGRFIRVEVSRLELPDRANIEPLRLVFRKRQCIRYTVRNIRLMGTESGDNDVRLYFGQAPAARIEAPGPFRLASVPINFVPPASRVPDGAILEVLDTEFVRYPQSSFLEP